MNAHTVISALSVSVVMACFASGCYQSVHSASQTQQGDVENRVILLTDEMEGRLVERGILSDIAVSPNGVRIRRAWIPPSIDALSNYIRNGSVLAGFHKIWILYKDLDSDGHELFWGIKIEYAKDKRRVMLKFDHSSTPEKWIVGALLRAQEDLESR